MNEGEITPKILRVYSKYAAEGHQDTPSPCNDLTDATGGDTKLDFFMCKCAIIDIFGIVLKKKKLIALLRRYCPLAVEDGFVSKPEFLALCESIQDTMPVNFHLKNMYESLDPTNKGYITEDDFMAVFFSIAPHLATARGRDIYRAADTYSLGKITYSQMETMLANANNLDHRSSCLDADI